jgi:hypothetical protein
MAWEPLCGLKEAALDMSIIARAVSSRRAYSTATQYSLSRNLLGDRRIKVMKRLAIAGPLAFSDCLISLNWETPRKAGSFLSGTMAQ